jgi:hypothetical protein
MRFMRNITVFAALAVGVAAAASNYSLNLGDKVWVGDKELKPGDYKVTINGDKATIKSGKTVVEVPAKIESSPNKYSVSTIDSKSDGGKVRLTEIHVGGTTTRIVLQGDQSTAHGE